MRHVMFRIFNSASGGLGQQFSSRVLRNYGEGWKRTGDRAARFSDRALRNYAVSAHLLDGLAIVAAAGDAPAEILLYDEIGFWGITAKDFVQALATAGEGPLTLRINSPGGDVFDGLAIYNALRARKAPVTVVVDGLAASAASFIAMAGTTVTMAEQSMLMIHNAWGICMGDRNDMLDMSAVMEKIDAQLADIYAGKSAKPAADIRALMDDETWFTSSEAKATGLCDAIVVPAKPDAQAMARAVRIKSSAPRAAAGDLGISRLAARSRAAYDPDGDGDDDAAEAVGLIQAAIGSLTDAIESLTGTEPADDAGAAANRARVAEASATAAAAEAAATAAAAEETAAAQARAAAQERRLRLAAAEAA